MRRPGTHKVIETFSDASAPDISIRPARPKKRPAPFSLRLSYEERAQLETAAGNIPLGQYIKGRLFDGLPAVPRQRSAAKIDKAAIANLLGRLGQSQLAVSMREIASAAHNGSLPVTPDLENELKAACGEISDVRRALLKALGHKG